jgi:flavin-dependent thymidylate synthase
MRVLLAGYNVDSEVLESLKKNSPPRDDVTPEILSAAYARISRDPRPADELRSVARREVERARRSNRAIIFKMGHHSVAEHAVFNFDVIGVSRLAIEEIEKFRLCSYTEKSQRYIKLSDETVVPEEIERAGMVDEFLKTARAQNALYRKLSGRLKSYFSQKNKEWARDSRKKSLLEGWAIEDARYVVCLASKGQLGLTINARNLELLIRRFASKQLAELQLFNREIYDSVKEIAPSIILFTDTNDFDAHTYPELRKRAEVLMPDRSEARDAAVRLVDSTEDADCKLVAALLHTSSSFPFDKCLQKSKRMTFEARLELVKTALSRMEFYDSVLREFEYLDLVFEIVLSAAAFAQLKRHRMATLTAQSYDPGLGNTFPPSLRNIGADQEMARLIERTNDVYTNLKQKIPIGADYILTNSHRRRILAKVNARELYHISRLREDATAQWDIRGIASKMSEQAKAVMPLTFLLLGGKDRYAERFEEVFGYPPKVKPPQE